MNRELRIHHESLPLSLIGAVASERQIPELGDPHTACEGARTLGRCVLGGSPDCRRVQGSSLTRQRSALRKLPPPFPRSGSSSDHATSVSRRAAGLRRADRTI